MFSQDPILLTDFPSQIRWKFLSSSFLDSNNIIATKFSIWYDSCTVVACANICCDMMPSNGITARRSFTWIWIASEKSLVTQVTASFRGWISCAVLWIVLWFDSSSKCKKFVLFTFQELKAPRNSRPRQWYSNLKSLCTWYVRICNLHLLDRHFEPSSSIYAFVVAYKTFPDSFFKGSWPHFATKVQCQILSLSSLCCGGVSLCGPRH